MEDWNGAILNTWNGELTPTIFDKFKTQQTLGQDPPTVLSFQQQRNKIYRGKASIINGYFDFEFIVPKDIALNYGLGKITDEQLVDFAKRKNMDYNVAKKWLNPNLAE